MTTYEYLKNTETYRTVIENAPAGPVWLQDPADSRFVIALDIAFGGPDYRENGASADTITDALESMTNGYLTALLWTSNRWSQEELDAAGEDSDIFDDDNYLDAGFTIEDVTPEFRARVLDHLLGVVVAHPLAVRLYGARRSGEDGNTYRVRPIAEFGAWDYFGHDYMLTRDHHGVGFWDRGLGELGDYLTNVAESNGGSEYENGSLRLTTDGRIDG